MNDTRTRAQIAESLGVSEHSVNAWLKPETSKGHRPVPESVLKLYRLQKMIP